MRISVCVFFLILLIKVYIKIHNLECPPVKPVLFICRVMSSSKLARSVSAAKLEHLESANAEALYLNVRMPAKKQRPHLEPAAPSTNSIKEENEDDENVNFYIAGDGSYDPTDKVQTLIHNVRDLKHRTKKLFVEMDVLTYRGDELEWREWARWVKYEEKVEDGGKRWSKPHVASLSMHHIMELRKLLLEGVFLADRECYSISQVVEHFLDAWIETECLDTDLRQYVRNLCLNPHRHRHEKGRHDDKGKLRKASHSDLHRIQSTTSINAEHLKNVSSFVSLRSDLSSETDLEGLEQEENLKHQNERFLRKIPKGSEVANVMVAEVEELSHFLCGFLRLNDARLIGDLSEVNLPTRFVFFLFGPKGTLEQCQECGRCLSTVLIDEVFREVAYKARFRDDIVAGIDEFLEQTTVLPPGEWDPKIRIEPPEKVPNQHFRKVASLPDTEKGEHEEEEAHCDPELIKSGRLFGGLIQDIKRKLPWYASDFKDALHIQCLASFVYIFLATLTPNVTFGGMLGTETDQYMGVMECILAAAVSGVAFALFSGQPLNILGSTGPMLVLEKIIYNFCKDNDWEFMSFRFWVGIWTAGLLLLIVAFDLSALVRYITRFTEESFASLIALIFIVEAFKKMADIAKEDAPLRLHPDGPYVPNCYCNYTDYNNTMPMSFTNVTWSSLDESECNTWIGNWPTTATGMLSWDCDPLFYKPDIFLFCLIIFFGTFFIAVFLVDFRHWPCFPTFVRNILGDFSVLIAIVSMVVVDVLCGLDTPKLTVPSEFKPTKSEARDWVVDPFAGNNPWWLALAAGLPALLATILIFMDQQITAVIVNRKENKLKKGKGYHLDLLVLCVIVAIHSLLGLPWFVAATVSAIVHVDSLKKQSQCTAPGEKPTFLGVREQRVTALLVAIFSGAAVFLTNILKVIPMAVLYGVFLYMGWAALKGMQFIDRLLLVFMPVKYQPDHTYLRHVPLWRVHVFTLIQVLCLAALWVVKTIKSISIVFPLLVVLTGVVRKLLEYIYTQNELKYLDDILPSTKTNKKPLIDKVAEEESNKKISDIISNARKDFYNDNGKNDIGSNGNPKVNFFITDDLTSPTSHDNKAFDISDDLNTKL